MKSMAELKARAKLAWSVLKASDGNIIAHAQRELAPWYEGRDEMDVMMADDVMDLLRVFTAQGHSGFSAPYAVSVFKTLAEFEPLGPLTGEEQEWIEITDLEGILYQNRRCGRVFKSSAGAYDIEGVVFEEPNGVRFTSLASRVFVNFPYTPRTVIAKISDTATEEEKIAAAAKALAA